MATKEYVVYFAVASTAASPEAAAIDALKALQARTGECDTWEADVVVDDPDLSIARLLADGERTTVHVHVGPEGKMTTERIE